jgi:hypothetical protein
MHRVFGVYVRTIALCAMSLCSTRFGDVTAIETSDQKQGRRRS